MNNPAKSTSASSNTGQFFGFAGLLVFVAVALYVIGPEVVADTFRKASGGLTTAEQVQLAEQFERVEAARLRNIEIERQKLDQRKRDEQARAAQKEREQRQADRSILEDKEKNQYLSARGDADRLKLYLRDCIVCGYQNTVRNEIAQLEAQQKEKELQEAQRRFLEEKERNQYASAQGDLDRLRLYMRDCIICDYQVVARDEISRLEAQERARQSPVVTFRLKSNHPNAVAYKFYSGANRSRVWPGGVLADSDIHTERLSCEPGEKICYGAWVQGAFSNPAWGMGAKGKLSCTSCCLTCPVFESSTIVLESGNAQTPLPDVTWNVSKNFGGALALSFYSTLRQGHSWPGGGRVYILNDQSSHQYELSCIAGEQICYGAWVNGNPDGTYWGAGPGGRHSCVNCCGVCNGGEYRSDLGE